MAAPMVSLLTPGTIKHVVPWKSRSEFLDVYRDLFSGDESLQQKAVNRITTWKSRAGSKLSVAIESCGLLMQASLDHKCALKDNVFARHEPHLKSSYSLALIRFVNHITEKGQNKSTAQPVHIVAREFGIPEWIVRLRHDATHGSLPCLNSLETGTKWALNYLEENFWKHQTVDTSVDDAADDDKPRMPKMSDIRRAFYDYQTARFQEMKSEEKEVELDHSVAVRSLIRHFSLNRLKFLQCFLEDGILISTEEQLEALGVQTEDLLSQSPPTITLEMAQFWYPLLKRLHGAGGLPPLLQTALFSITSGEGIRNYQLVAWIIFILSQCTDSVPRKTSKQKQKKRQQQEFTFKTASLPLKTLLSACLQNINNLTVYLLKYLADEESLGSESYNKLMKLLNIHTQAASAGESDTEDEDTIYTVEDLKQVRQKQTPQRDISSSTVQDIQSSMAEKENKQSPWQLCTEMVDWASVPLGVLPSALQDSKGDDNTDEDGEKEGGNDVNEGTSAKRHSSDHSSDDNDDEDDDDYRGGRRKGNIKRRRTDEEENSRNSDVSPSSKHMRHNVVMDGELL